MDIQQIKQQIEVANGLISQYKKQNVIFENIIQRAIKGTAGEEKTELMKVHALLLKSKNLSQQGKIDEVNSLIKQFKNGRKNSK